MVTTTVMMEGQLAQVWAVA